MTDELVGKIIGGYEVQHVIGRGGMATVYLARQQSMNRQVALKVLPKQFASDDTYLTRFEREVKIVSQLEHRNIVPVYDYGEYEGQPYIVMRYMPSGSVDDLLRNGPLEAGVMLSIVSQIAPALDYAHTKEVLHRDLKPSNVLMDEAGGAFITDFGIARLSTEHASAITTQGVVGTPSYMSPEQAQGKTLDGRSDVYSLGVMLFEMATGRRPFESDTPYSIAVMQVMEQPPMPRSIHPGLSTAMENVILKALRKKPEDRYQTANALLEALKLAIERPVSGHDTEPNLRKYIQEALAAAPPPLPPPPVSGTGYMPPASAAMPIPSDPAGRSLMRRKRRTNPLTSIFLGGFIGCTVLIALVLVGFVIITLVMGSPAPADILPSITVPAVDSNTSGGAPTLDPTSETARATLVARSIQNDATQTAAVVATRLSLSSTPSVNVGVRPGPTLRPGLRAAAGTVIFTGRRPVGDSLYYQILRLDLATMTETALTSDASNNTYPIVSPDGRWIAFQSDRDGDFDIYVMNTLGGQLVRLTDNGVLDRLPAWSPDGAWVIYASDRRGDGRSDLYRTRLDGSETELVYGSDERASHPRYSPDGRYLVFTTGPDPQDARTWEIARLDLESGDIIRLTNNSTRDASPVFSADGTRILYITFNDNDNAIAEMDVDGRNSRILYDSAGSDWAAAYSPDGQYILFTSNLGGDDQLYLMTAQGTEAQQITTNGGNYGSWIPES